MDIKKTVDNGRMTLVVAGRVDTLSAPELSDALALDGVDDVTIDFSNVPYMSSAGLRCLLVANKTMSAKGGEMRLVGVQKLVREVLDMTGFSDFFNID